MYTALLTAMVLWISANFDFPANYEHPNIKLVPASEITFLRYRAFTAAQQRELLSRQSASAAQTGRREAVAVYDDQTSTIFLCRTRGRAIRLRICPFSSTRWSTTCNHAGISDTSAAAPAKHRPTQLRKNG